MQDLEKLFQQDNGSFKSTFFRVVLAETGQEIFFCSIWACGELYMAIDGRRDPSEYWRQVVPPFLCPAMVLKILILPQLPF